MLEKKSTFIPTFPLEFHSSSVELSLDDKKPFLYVRSQFFVTHQALIIKEMNFDAVDPG